MAQALQQLIEIITQIEEYDSDSITNLEMAIQCLDEVYQANPKAIAKRIDRLVDILEVCLTEQPTIPILTISHLLDFIVGVIAGHPKLAKNNKNRCTRIFRTVINSMLKTSFQVQQAWLNPPNGYSHDVNLASAPEVEAENQFLSSFDTLVQTLDRPLSAQLFQPSFKEYLNISNDWRYSYAALMLASQLCGDSIKVDKLHNYVQSALLNLQHSHPKIRYASLHLIGQYSDDMKPQFQQTYFDTIIPLLLRKLQDPVSRVVSHDLACFTNFFENINEVWKIQSCIGQMLPYIIHYLKTGSSWIKETAISALSSFATTKDAFGPNLTQILSIASELVETYAGVPQFTQLVNQCFELISFIIGIQNSSQVGQYIGNFVDLMIKYRQNISGSYFLGAWCRLCQHHQSFVDVNIIFQQLMETVTQVVQQESDQTAQEALICLITTCKSFKVNIQPYTQRLIAFAQEIFVNKQKSSSLKQKSIELIVKSIVTTKCQVPSLIQSWKTLNISGIEFISKSIDQVSQNDYDELEYLYTALKNLILASIQYFNQTQIQLFAVKLQNITIKSEQLYQNLQTAKLSFNQEIDDEIQSNQNQINFIEQDMASILESVESIPEVFQALLNVNDGSSKKWLVDFIVQQSAKYVQKTGQWKLFGINVLIPLVQKCTYFELCNYWPNFLNIFITYSSNGHTRIRNSSIYGMGLMILNTPIEQISEQSVTSWLQCLWNAFSLPYLSDLDEYLMNHSKDNVISTIGKLLYKCGSKFPSLLNQQYYQNWISKLPLNVDKIQGDIQQHYLIQLLKNNPGIIVSSSEDLKSICVIYSSFLQKRHDHQNKIIINETKQSLKAIMNWPLFKESQAFLWSNLSKSQINRLTRFIST